MATAAKTARAVEVPGEPATAGTLNTAEGASQVDTAAEQIPQPEVIEGDEPAAEPNTADLDNAEVAALRAQLAAEQASRIAAEARAVAAASAAQAPKPTATTKGSAVLTDKGWTVPENYGAPAVKV